MPRQTKINIIEGKYYKHCTLCDENLPIEKFSTKNIAYKCMSCINEYSYCGCANFYNIRKRLKIIYQLYCQGAFSKI